MELLVTALTVIGLTALGSIAVITAGLGMFLHGIVLVLKGVNV